MYRVRRVLSRLCPAPVLQFLRNAVARRRAQTFANQRMVERALRKRVPTWEPRIRDVVACPDNQLIPRVADAGHIRDGWIVMHNGLQVAALSYYGAGMLQMLVRNRGVHEPQEERVFREILPFVEQGSAMLELGGYWAFYSLWFTSVVPNARPHVVEPDRGNLVAGQMNFDRAGKHGVFERAFIGPPQHTSDDGTPVISVDDFCRRHGLGRVAILHADIQGAEVDMLHGAWAMLDAAAIDYVFISTHSDELHRTCLELLGTLSYEIVAEAGMSETYSYDGLIVAKAPNAPGPRRVCISKKGEVAAT